MQIAAVKMKSETMILKINLICWIFNVFTNPKGCRNVVTEVTFKVSDMVFAPSVYFIKFQKAHRSALLMNIFCCKPKMMKGLIAFQFIAY